MTLNFYEELIENDLNPVIVFDHNAKIHKFNKEAEYLLSIAKKQELFDLALNNAPQSYGFENKYMILDFDRVQYYAILVGYIDDEYIAIKFYQKVRENYSAEMMDQNLQNTNVFTLLKLAGSSILTTTKIKECYDPSIPEIKLDINKFLKLINEIFEIFTKSEHLEITVFIKTGEYIILKDKRRQICNIKFKTYEPVTISSDLRLLANRANIELYVSPYEIGIELPMIL
jgi:nitrogen-specific signal transduction histidine kinase